MATISPATISILRWVARIFSAIIVLFALVMFIGETMESANRANATPLTPNAIIQLTIFGIGLLGLAMAWKWELPGGILSLIAFIVLFIVKPGALVWPMLIFPVNAILFIVPGYGSRNNKNIMEE